MDKQARAKLIASLERKCKSGERAAALERAKETYFYTSRYDDVFREIQDRWTLPKMREARQQYTEIERTKKLSSLPTEPAARIKKLRHLAYTTKPETIHQYIKYLSVLAEVTKCTALYENTEAPLYVKRLQSIYFSDMYQAYRERVKVEKTRSRDSPIQSDPELTATNKNDPVLPGLEGLPRLERPSSFRKAKVNIADFLMPGPHETRKLREDRVCGTLFMFDEDENYVFMVDSSVFSKRAGKFFNVQVEGSDYADRMEEEELIELLARSFQLLGEFSEQPV